MSDDEDVVYDEFDGSGSDVDDMDVDSGEIPEYGSDEDEDLEQDLRAVARGKIKPRKIHAYDEVLLRYKRNTAPIEIECR
jgi:hypothetical protein